MIELHVTWEQVDEMTLPQVQALNRHFEKIPPLRISVMACAKALGVTFPGPKSTPDASGNAPLDFVDLPEFES